MEGQELEEELDREAQEDGGDHWDGDKRAGGEVRCQGRVGLSAAHGDGQGD